MSKFDSPIAALEHIRDAVAEAHSGIVLQHGTLPARILDACTHGLASVPAFKGFDEPLPSTATDAFHALRREADVQGRHYLPAPWVAMMARAGLDALARGVAPARLTATQAAADKLLNFAYELESVLEDGDTGGPNSGLAELRAVLDPLRVEALPAAPVTPNPEHVKTDPARFKRESEAYRDWLVLAQDVATAQARVRARQAPATPPVAPMPVLPPAMPSMSFPGSR